MPPPVVAYKVFGVQNNDMAAMLVNREKNTVGIELFSHVKTSFFPKKFAYLLTT